MDRLSGFGMITGSLEVPSIVALKDHLCKTTKTTELAHYELIIIGPSILSTFLSHHKLNNLFRVSLWHELLGYLIPLFGPIIIGLAQLVLLQNFYTNKNMYLDKQLWNWIWKLQCSKKIQFFLWKAMHKRLHTKQFLAFSHPHINNLCPRCNSPETTIHILHDCP